MVGVLLLILNLTFPLLLLLEQDVTVTASFYLASGALLVLLKDIYFAKRVSISYVAVFVFSELFLFIAPIIQLFNDPAFLINTLPVDSFQIVLGNVLVSLFLLFFRFSYFQGGRGINHLKLSVSNASLDRLFPALVLLSLVSGIWALSNLPEALIVSADGFQIEKVALWYLFEVKVLYLLPFVATAIYLSRGSRQVNLLFLLLLISLVLLTKNPIFDRRNALGPVYLTLLILAFPWLISTAKRGLLFLVIVMVIFFPASSIFTHYVFGGVQSDLAFNDLLARQIIGHFSDMHYDAWASIIGMLDLVEKSGLSLGGQAAGVVFFFVPREIWIAKPVATGELLGQYLSANYNLWFTNISAALPAEGYNNFGFIGVLVFAVILGKWVAFLDHLVRCELWLAKITGTFCALYLFFLLRGSLLPAIAYLVGALTALVLVPLLLGRIGRALTTRPVRSPAKYFTE